MKWIDAGDIKIWATGKQRHCAQTLPELVRRLILATANTVEEIDFPGGDSIAGGGWDGRLRTPVVTPFFPSGISGWEISAEKSPSKKAEADYAKRAADPLGFVPNETAFVFVTPHPFANRGKWQSDKCTAKKWKDVRVIGADGLEQWLESAPAVSLWLARQIGKIVSGGIRGIENVWEEWSLATNPNMTIDMVIGGRTKDVEEIHKWIAEKPRILSVQGDSPDEAVAFLYAAISALPETDMVQAFARCVVVENIGELRQLTQAFQSYPLIIAAPGGCIEAAGAAVTKGHHVFLNMDAKVIDIGNFLRLSRPQYGAIEKNLLQNGFSEADAQRLSKDFGRSIPVLRRHLYRSSTVNAPAWASADSARLLLPVLFAGSWTDDKEGDRQVLEALSEMTYTALTNELAKFLSIDDAPIRKIGSVWMLKSPLDAWFLLARHLDNDSLKRFERSITTVLTQTDPKYDLPPEQRWAAAIYGKSNQYSEWLHTGLVESLVLLAVYGDRSPKITSTQAFADRIVRQIFNTAQKWEAWASLKDITPLLTESSPDTFIEIVEQGITKNPELFKELMRDGSGIFGECRHSGLLWALESTAWSSQYFSRTVGVLTGLALIDSGGQWSNRAVNSLKDIFLPGLPQTHATPAERLAALDSLMIKDPRKVWEFTKGYYGGGNISESHRFRWRDAGGERRGLEPEKNEDYREYLKGLLPKLSDLACRKENLIDSIGDFTRLPIDVRERLLKILETADPGTFSKEERGRLLQEIREALNWINSYGDEDRRTHVRSLNWVLEKFSSEDVLERVGWLLSTPWPRLPQGEPKEYGSKDTAVKSAQEKAAREILDKTSLEKIIEFAAVIEYPGVLGYTLGKVVRDKKEDSSVLDAMLKNIADKPILIRSYSQGRIEAVGAGWIDAQLERIKTEGSYSPETCALLYLGLPEGSETWTKVNLHGKEVERAYWKRARGYSRTDKAEDAAIAIEKLLNVKRPAAALEIAGDPKVSIPSPLLKRLLQNLLTFTSEEKKIHADVMTEYHLGYVFNQLYERNELPVEEIAKLEWPFASLFGDLKRYTSSPLAIHRVLQKDPSFFAQLVCFMYKRDDHAPDHDREGIDDKRGANIARNAHNVLDSWRLLPGLGEDGSLDEKELVTWVESAREQCAAKNRIIGGDLQIGFMLAHAPGDSDGTWPHTAVRNLIEQLNNEIIDRHIQTGIYNSRGVVSRGLNDGGRQERDLANRYKKMSGAVKIKWPRTAALLRSIAESYEYQAKHEDVDSDLHDLRWN